MSKLICSLTLIAGVCASPVAVSASVIADAASAMAGNSWLQISTNSLADVLAPAALRPSLYRPLSQISSWVGSAWDGSRESLYFWGGDYNGHEGNEVYAFSAKTGLWSRASLPSQITTSSGVLTTVDGINNAPTAGESYDNVVYLKGVDRLGVMGVSRDGASWAYPGGQPAGPYFWDPAKADANKVGGLTGSHVNPQPGDGIVGGQMWQNRGTGAQINGGPAGGVQTNGTSDAVVVNGKDVVYLTNQYDDLFRYNVGGLDPATDTVTPIGRRSITGQTSGGSAAIDTSRNLYLKSLGQSFVFWDLGSTASYSNNRGIKVTPTVLTNGVSMPDTTFFGIEYDAANHWYTMWDGSNFVWVLRAPDDLDINNDGVSERADGWTLERLNPLGAAPSIPAQYVGVYGNWNYIEEYGVFMGVIDPLSADVYLYKPTAAVPEPGTWALLLAGVGLLSAVARRRG